MQGNQVRTEQLDEALLGGEVNVALLKQAVVSYRASARQGTVCTKNRADVAGSTRKLYRQKGTGNARRGNVRTNVMRGGGMAFGKRNRDFRQDMPRKMKRAALKSAILAKALGQDLMLVQGLACPEIKTRQMAAMLKSLKINRSCLLALAASDRNVYLSSRNLPDLTVRVACDLNAYDVASRRKMLVAAEAWQGIVEGKKQ
jgi:large subunit ribosomal protein L4